jgi:hypothetical protein
VEPLIAGGIWILNYLRDEVAEIPVAGCHEARLK